MTDLKTESILKLTNDIFYTYLLTAAYKVDHYGWEVLKDFIIHYLHFTT